MNITILFEDKDLIVCEKPAGMPVQPDRSNAMDLQNYLKNHIFQQTKKTPELFTVHRLDRPVGGLMVFAKNKRSASELGKDFQNKTSLSKRYLALVQSVLPVSGQIHTLTDYIKKDGKTNLSILVPKNDPDAKKAVLHYQTLFCDRKRSLSLVEVDLITGRHHQIRLQTAAHLGGIYGDRKYNKASEALTGFSYPALYSHRLSFLHPVTKEKLSFEKWPDYGIFSEFPKCILAD